MSPRTLTTLPDVDPVLLTIRTDPFDDPDWLFEPKYDGCRGLLYVTRRGCHFRSRSGGVLTRFQELCYWIREELPVREAILDGQVVGDAHYAAFDVLWVDGKDLRPAPLTTRKRGLFGLVPASTSLVSQVFSIEERGRDMFAAAERLDLEGIVAKRKSDRYGPETVWYQILSRTYTPGKGRQDCSRHGSRFSPTGAVINGPAVSGLSGAETPAPSPDR